MIEDIGTLAQIEQTGEGARVSVRVDTLDLSDVQLGESIAVDGACFTVVRWDDKSFSFEASSETLARTTLSERRVGDPVHLERAMKVGGRLGGHMVQGHVDGVGVVAEVERGDEVWRVDISAPPTLMTLVVEKGSIAIDGVSLTVNRVTDDRLSVTVIPHTAGNTNLTKLGPGAQVNLETDIIGKYVWRFLAARGDLTVTEAEGDHGGIDLALLMQHGFAVSGE